MLKTKFRILIVFLLMTVESSFAGDVEFDAIFESAFQLFQEGAYTSSIAEFKRGLYYAPETIDNSPIYYQLGQCYFKLGKHAKARQFWMPVLAREQDSILANKTFKGVIKSYILDHQYGLAETELSRHEGIKGINPFEIEYLSGMNYLSWGKWKTAKLKFKSILKSQQFSENTEFEDWLTQGLELPLKNPHLAALYSSIIPGSGQIYAGKYANGVVAFILNAGLVYFTYWLLSEQCWFSGGLTALYTYGIWRVNIRNAHNFVMEHNKTITDKYSIPILIHEW